MVDHEPCASSPPTHVVLVGMMGVGKTTVGKRVARLLERPFFDADGELERRSSRTIAKWFASDGEPAFREAEAEVLSDLLDQSACSVVAAGGGVVIAERNRDRLRQGDAFVVWLRADLKFLAARVARKNHRPLVADDPLGTLTRLSAERAPWYAEVADTVIDVSEAYERERPKWVLAEQVVDALHAYEAAGSVDR